MTSTLKVTRMFFDRQAVISAVDKATRTVFGRFGAFTRRIAKNSIRQRKGTSAPGNPPFSHTGLLKKFLFFSWDPAQRSVVIGPARLNGRGRGYGAAPAILEYGGTTERSFLNASVEWRKKTVVEWRKKTVVEWRKKTVRVRPRPYMAPAFERAKARLPDMWAGSVKP